MFAHFYGSKAKGYWVEITESPSPVAPISQHRVANKAEARRVAAERGAKPWNF